MPRKRRPSYGVQRKHKRPRYHDGKAETDSNSETADHQLNTAFCDPSPSSDIECNDSLSSQLNNAFLEPTCRETLVEESSTTETTTTSEDWFQSLKSDLLELPEPFILNRHASDIQILSFYDGCPSKSVKLTICINENARASIFLHNREVSCEHRLWDRVPKTFSSKKDILKLLSVLNGFKVCNGNPDEPLVSLIPVGAGISNAVNQSFTAVREGNFGASENGYTYSSSVRSVNCSLLIDKSIRFPRCSVCYKVRTVLKLRHERKENLLKRDVDFTSTNYKNSDMPREVLLKKLNQQRDHLSLLHNTVAKLQRQLSKKISCEGVMLNQLQSIEMKDLMECCQKEVETSFPDSNSFQRLFWNQQLRTVASGKYGMRWHPMIIRWCLAIRQKSQAAYDTVREAGFIQLPSNRTLFDYSHFVNSDLGFNSGVCIMLKDEAVKLKMYDEAWRKYVGLLFDEIKVKEDLVYDKISGELVGYCNLDSVGNTILNLESNLKEKDNVAKFVLVIMVRGVATSLKFPLAAFATQSISADFLYPIVWTAVSVLEVHLKLRVLFITCDGASANRKFFNMHALTGVVGVHYTQNPFDRKRSIYFISDVPHLLKTVRNCFSNSYSHKKTRQLWKDGKDISWMHVVRLFEEHCEFNLYTPCPKLTRNHIDLNAFSYMKVNLAAQVLSDSVANALQDLYDESMIETVLFIRTMNKFFDILNVRSLQEGRNKRNPNLNPFMSVSDERLTWLSDSFVGYLSSWAESVSKRHGPFAKKERSAMQLSHQTVTGLIISVKSIAECVKFLLNEGASFVLTGCFNQDPLEQHFGHYRHKGGNNRNPTVNDVKHILTNIRTVGAVGLVIRRGNTEVRPEQPVIDDTKLPKRR